MSAEHHSPHTRLPVVFDVFHFVLSSASITSDEDGRAQVQFYHRTTQF